MSYLNERILTLINKITSLPQRVQDCIDDYTPKKEGDLIQAVTECDGMWADVKMGIVRVFEAQQTSAPVAGIPTDNGVLICKEDDQNE